MVDVLCVNLRGGLCNKLICLSEACIIAEKENLKILEPRFGWGTKWQKVHFSEIYDIQFFNEKMKQFTNGKVNIIIEDPLEKYNKRDDKYYKKGPTYLWSNSIKTFRKLRAQKTWGNSMISYVIQSLRLNKQNQEIVNKFVDIQNIDALHIRIESDWIKYAKGKKKPDKDQIYIIDLKTLISHYKSTFPNRRATFFTTGENHENIKKEFLLSNIDTCYHYNNNLDYETNAAINFELCCQANRFIGLSSSTYSNLISFKRSLNNRHSSFIYNYKNAILERHDSGLYADPNQVVAKIM
tara:strand:+ start:4727 stop:5614 length:888 start_codon:yes stop_codon:yes gene_type:complete